MVLGTMGRGFDSRYITVEGKSQGRGFPSIKIPGNCLLEVRRNEQCWDQGILCGSRLHWLSGSRLIEREMCDGEDAEKQTGKGGAKGGGVLRNAGEYRAPESYPAKG